MTMAENGVVESPHDVPEKLVNASEENPTLQDLWTVDFTSTKPNCVPLFCQNLMTVEQLGKVTIDPDIQSAVNDFLKGLTTQMFARIVRNGSAEVGRWLGAKVQGEREGWLAMLRMAMEEIEFHRKNSLQAQVLLHDILDQLRLLVDCFQVEEEAKSDVMSDDVTRGIQASICLLAQGCNALMEDRFRCVDILGCADSIPDSVSAEVQQLKEKLDRLTVEKTVLASQCQEVTEESSQLRRQNEHLLEQVQKMGDRVRGKQADLETLKAQLKEIDHCVQLRKATTAEKSVGTTLDLFQPGLQGPRRLAEAKTQTVSTEAACAATTQPPDPEFRCPACGQACKVPGEAPQNCSENAPRRKLPVREPSFIELSEEKLRVLKERARQLETSLHGALASMERVRGKVEGGGGGGGGSNSSNNGAAPVPVPHSTRATFLTLPSQGRGVKDSVSSWVMTCFQVGNQTGVPVVTAAVPKLGHFKAAGSERRCLSERPPDNKGQLQLLAGQDASPSTSRAGHCIPSLTGSQQGRVRSLSLVSQASWLETQTTAGHHLQAGFSGHTAASLASSRTGRGVNDDGNDFVTHDPAPAPAASEGGAKLRDSVVSLKREPAQGTAAQGSPAAHGAGAAAAKSDRRPAPVAVADSGGGGVGGSRAQRGSDPSRRTVRGGRVSQVSKCLRCQKLFTATDNHKLACCFHSKEKERVEVYSDGGQLVKVNYVWTCCQQLGGADGCCYGHHV